MNGRHISNIRLTAQGRRNGSTGTIRAFLASLLWLLALGMPGIASAQDKSNHILLIHASQYNTSNTGSYPNTGDETSFGTRSGTDAGIRYTAEYLRGLMVLTDEFADLEVDFESVAFAHSLADIYYDPQFSDIRSMIGSGYRYVIFFDSEQAAAFPEVMFEGVSKLSELVLNSGGTPLLMMYRSDHVDIARLGETTYRAGNGMGVEVVPASYAYDAAGLQGRLLSEERARQALISASAIFRTITGLKAEDLDYVPTYEHAGVNEFVQFSFPSEEIEALTTLATETVDAHKSISHYDTSYELDGAVVYRDVDIASAPFNGDVRYYFKGTSTHEFTESRLNTIINDSLSATSIQFGRLSGGQRFWTDFDTGLRTETLTNRENVGKGQFLFASGTNPGADAQDLIDLNGENLVPLVFDWIKAFGGNTGTAATLSALDEENCANLWFNYHFRGWKTIPLTIGMGRLNELFRNFSASDDDLHISDPLVYMNAAMMIASSMGTELPVPDNLPIRRGNWTQAQLELAIETGHDLIKELAYMSETAAFVPDSDLSIETDSLPGFLLGQDYNFQLSATGGTGAPTWELISGTELPPGLSLSESGSLSGTPTANGTWDLAFQATDEEGAFRKVGLKLSDSPVSSAYLAWVSSNDLSGEDAQFDADVDGDGLTNLLEFALGTNPNISDAESNIAAYTELDGSTEFFVYEYERRTDYEDLGMKYTVIATPDLVTPISDPPHSVEIGDPVNGFERMTNRYPIEADSKFFQLRVEVN